MYSLAKIQPLLTSKLKAVGTFRKETSWTNLGVRTSIKNQIIIISESYFQTRQNENFSTILSLLPTQRGIEPRSKCFEHYHTVGLTCTKSLSIIPQIMLLSARLLLRFIYWPVALRHYSRQGTRYVKIILEKQVRDIHTESRIRMAEGKFHSQAPLRSPDPAKRCTNPYFHHIGLRWRPYSSKIWIWVSRFGRSMGIDWDHIPAKYDEPKPWPKRGKNPFHIHIHIHSH